MKILLVSYSDCRSGNASRLLNLALPLSQRHDVNILFDGGTDNALPGRFSGLRLHFTPWLGFLYPTLVLGIPIKLLQGLARGKSDIVHCFKPLPTSFLPAWLIARLTGARLLLDWDDWEGKGGFADRDPPLLRDFIDWFQGFALRHCDGLIVVSPYLYREARRKARNVFLIPNGADLASFQPAAAPNPAQDGARFSLLFLGHLFKSSDLDLALHALKHSLSVNVELLVVGDGPRRAEFEELARDLGVANKVRFQGHVSRDAIPEFLAKADAVCLPMADNLANRSRFPVKLGEYLAAGKPIIASPIGVINDYLEDQRNALLAPTPAAFGRAIDTLASNPGLRAALSANARATAERRMDWKEFAAQLEKVYLLYQTANLS